MKYLILISLVFTSSCGKLPNLMNVIEASTNVWRCNYFKGTSSFHYEFHLEEGDNVDEYAKELMTDNRLYGYSYKCYLLIP